MSHCEWSASEERLSLDHGASGERAAQKCESERGASARRKRASEEGEARETPTTRASDERAGSHYAARAIERRASGTIACGTQERAKSERRHCTMGAVNGCLKGDLSEKRATTFRTRPPCERTGSEKKSTTKTQERTKMDRSDERAESERPAATKKNRASEERAARGCEERLSERGRKMGALCSPSRVGSDFSNFYTLPINSTLRVQKLIVDNK